MRIPTVCIISVILMSEFNSISINGNAQNLKSDKKLQKEARKATIIEDFDELGKILESRRFVFEANTKQNREGLIVNVNSGRNYIRIDSLNISMNFERMEIGMQNVVDYINSKPMFGDILHWELLRNSKKLYYYLIVRSTSNSEDAGIYSFTMHAFANKNAKVKIGIGKNSGYNVFNGFIKPF